MVEGAKRVSNPDMCEQSKTSLHLEGNGGEG